MKDEAPSIPVTAAPPRTNGAEGGGAPPVSGALLRKQVMQYAPAVLLPAVLSMVAAATFTRVFAAAEYGRFTLAWSVGTVVVLLASQWLQQGITRFVPAAGATHDPARLKGSIALGLLCILGATLVLGALAVALGASLLPPPWPHDVAGGAAMVLATSLFAPLGAVVQAEMRAARYSRYVVATSVARLLLGLGLVFSIARTPASLLWAQAGAVLLVFPFLWRDAGLPPVRTVLREASALWRGVRSLAGYGYPVVGFTIAATLLDVSDRWIIQYFHGVGAAGIYAANYSLVVGTIGLLAAPTLLAAHPFLMRAWAGGDRDSAGRWLGRIVEWYIIAGVLLVGVVAIHARDIADVMLGPAFREGHPIIPVVLAGLVIWQLGMYSHKPLEFAERTGTMFALGAGITALNVGANLVVVPRYGYLGAAYTSVLAYAGYTVAATIVGRRILPWSIRWGHVARSTSVTVVLLLATWGVRVAMSAAAGRVAGAVAAGVLAAATALVVLWPEVGPMLRPARSDGPPPRP